MSEPKLTDEAELELLSEKVTWLEQSIADVDRDIASAILRAKAECSGHDGLADLQKYQANCDLMFCVSASDIDPSGGVIGVQF